MGEQELDVGLMSSTNGLRVRHVQMRWDRKGTFNREVKGRGSQEERNG